MLTRIQSREPVLKRGSGRFAAALHDRSGKILRDCSGQAVAEFSLVVLLLVLVLFSILETGLLLNEKLVLTSAAREVARICAVEGGRTPKSLERLTEILSAAGIPPASVKASITPNQAIYGTTITVDLSYEYQVKSPVIQAVIGVKIPLTAKAVTRSEFVPR